MRLALFIAIFLPNLAFAFDINGTWSRDVEHTKEFNDKNTVKPTDLFRMLYTCNINAKMTFTDGKRIQHADDTECIDGEDKIHVQGYDTVNEYKIIGKNQDTVVVEVTSSSGEKLYETFYIVTNNLIWSYEGRPGKMDYAHMRVYYQREK